MAKTVVLKSEIFSPLKFLSDQSQISVSFSSLKLFFFFFSLPWMWSGIYFDRRMMRKFRKKLLISYSTFFFFCKHRIQLAAPFSLHLESLSVAHQHLDRSITWPLRDIQTISPIWQHPFSIWFFFCSIFMSPPERRDIANWNVLRFRIHFRKKKREKLNY